MDKGSGSGIFPDPDPGDQKRPDPTGSGSGSATLKGRVNFKFLENNSQKTMTIYLKGADSSNLRGDP